MGVKKTQMALTPNVCHNRKNPSRFLLHDPKGQILRSCRQVRVLRPVQREKKGGKIGLKGPQRVIDKIRPQRRERREQKKNSGKERILEGEDVRTACNFKIADAG